MIINFRAFIINFDKVESIEKDIAFFRIYLTNKVYTVFNEKDYEKIWAKDLNPSQYVILPENDFQDFASLLREWSNYKYVSI